MLVITMGYNRVSSSLFCLPGGGASGGGGLGGGDSGGGTWPVPNCSHRIDSSSSRTAVAGMLGAVIYAGGSGSGCDCGGFSPVLVAARPWRLYMSVFSSSA